MWAGKGDSLGFLPFRALLIVVAVPLFTFLAIILPALFADSHGDVTEWLKRLYYQGPKVLIHLPTWIDIKIYFIYVILELTLMKIVPGEIVYGPKTATNHIPRYKNNGIYCYILTIIIFITGSYLNFYSLSIIYDHLSSLIFLSNIVALILCVFLMFKGLYFPSTLDCSDNNSILFNYWWGTELYPRIFDIDIKVFTNCRFGMMSWMLIVISSCYKQYELFGKIHNSILLSAILQFIYVTKFYIWEPGYYKSIDIMQDRAGYYICWGCMVWLPTMYPSPAVAMVQHPYDWSTLQCFLILLLGTLMIYINYDSDRQREYFREKKGQCRIWGQPAKYIKAEYKTHNGQIHESLLLLNGYWGLSRHFHYVPEILASFFWSLPGGFHHYGHFIYVFPYLCLLLLDRAYRDDHRCLGKYGKYWINYCQQVPYKIIPYLL